MWTNRGGKGRTDGSSKLAKLPNKAVIVEWVVFFKERKNGARKTRSEGRRRGTF